MNEDEKNISYFYDQNKISFNRERQNPWKCTRLFLQFSSNLNTTKNLLEIGCGTGYNLVYAKKKGYNVHGCDVSLELINVCKKKNLNVQYGNALKLPYENEYFDILLYISVIHHIDPKLHEDVLKEAKRVLKTNNIIFVFYKTERDIYVKGENNTSQKIYSINLDQFVSLFIKYFGTPTNIINTEIIYCVQKI